MATGYGGEAAWGIVDPAGAVLRRGEHLTVGQSGAKGFSTGVLGRQRVHG